MKKTMTLVSCTKELPSDGTITKDGLRTLTVSFASSPTKTTVDGLQPKWSENDEILLAAATEKELTFENQTAVFKVSVPNETKQLIVTSLNPVSSSTGAVLLQDLNFDTGSAQGGFSPKYITGKGKTPSSYAVEVNTMYTLEAASLHAYVTVGKEKDARKWATILIIVEEYKGQKIDDILKYRADIFTVGSDWEGYFDYLKEYCQVVYLPRTEGIGSSGLREKINHKDLA